MQEELIPRQSNVIGMLWKGGFNMYFHCYRKPIRIRQLPQKLKFEEGKYEG